MRKEEGERRGPISSVSTGGAKSGLVMAAAMLSVEPALHLREEQTGVHRGTCSCPRSPGARTSLYAAGLDPSTLSPGPSLSGGRGQEGSWEGCSVAGVGRAEQGTCFGCKTERSTPKPRNQEKSHSNSTSKQI